MSTIPGNWQVCSAGCTAPSNAVRAPDSYGSNVALWDYDYTIGRSCLLQPDQGIDAWFPWGGSEHSARQKGFTFRILLEDYSSPFEWVRVQEVLDRQNFIPFSIQGYVPVVLMNVYDGKNLLGKAMLSRKQAWVSYGGREISVQDHIVSNGMALCQRIGSKVPSQGVARRDVQIHQVPPIKTNSVCTTTLTRVERKFNNPNAKPMEVDVQISFDKREGQSWEFDAKEHSELRTVFQAQTIIDALIRADIPLGWALQGEKKQSITRESVSMTRSFTVPAYTQRVIRLSIQCQEMTSRCMATEITYDRDGCKLLQRDVYGTWRGATSKMQTCEFLDSPARLI